MFCDIRHLTCHAFPGHVSLLPPAGGGSVGVGSGWGGVGSGLVGLVGWVPGWGGGFWDSGPNLGENVNDSLEPTTRSVVTISNMECWHMCEQQYGLDYKNEF